MRQADDRRPVVRGGGSSPARRYLSLALWAAVLMSPSIAVAAGLLTAGAVLLLGPGLWRARGRRQARRAAAGERGSVIGVDPDGRPVGVTDAQRAAHGLVVGASGAGKSTTLVTLLDAQIRLGRPVIAIDMKGSPAFAAQLRRAAAASGRGLRVFTAEGPGHWNPLAHGNATSLKDMLISSERFSEPHYQRAAERYLQAALGVLLAVRPGRPVQLHEVVAVMEPRRLGALLRNLPGPLADPIQDYLASLTPDQVSAVRGLGTRLALLSESCAGPFLRTVGAEPGSVIDLRAGLEGGDVILFSLNSSLYGKLAAQLGTLAIQDLVSATGRRLGTEAASPTGAQPAMVAIDEFSALDNDNVLALLARGRESGVNVLVATQEMADLERAGRGFCEQVVGIVGIKIIHRQDVPDSADMIAQMAGTERVWEETQYVRGLFSSGGGPRGTRRPVERYLVHPNEIKALEPGEAVILSKLPSAQVRRVRVTPPPRAGAGPDARAQPPTAPPRAGASPDARAQPPAAPPSPGDGRKPVPEAPGARERADPPTERPPRAAAPGPVRRSGPGPGRSGGRGEPPGRDHPAPGVTR